MNIEPLYIDYVDILDTNCDVDEDIEDVILYQLYELGWISCSPYPYKIVFHNKESKSVYEIFARWKDIITRTRNSFGAY